MFKKKIIGLIIFAMLVTMISPGNFTISNVKANSQFAGGTGTEEDPYLIENAQQLYNIRSESWKYFRLIADINLQDLYDLGLEGWDPIPSFNGVLDGAGYKIKNLIIDLPNSENVGFIEKVEGGEIKNVTFENSNVTGKNAAGVLFGIKEYYTSILKIKNVHFKNAEVKAKNVGTIGGQAHRVDLDNVRVENVQILLDAFENSSYAGGIFGTSTNSNIVNTEVSQTSITTLSSKYDSFSGGLVGQVGNTTLTIPMNIVNSTFSGLITSDISVGNRFAGGLVGRVQLHTTGGREQTIVNITDSYASGTIEDVNHASGLIGFYKPPVVGGLSLERVYANFSRLHGTDTVSGIARTEERITIKDSYSMSNIETENGEIYGIANRGWLINVYAANNTDKPAYGLVKDSTFSIDNSYYDKDILIVQNGDPFTNLGKTTTAMKNKFLYSGWDFENVWYLDEGNDYPRLRSTMDNIPVQIELIVNSKSESSVTIKWNDAGAASYTVLRDGAENATVMDLSYTDSDLSPNTTYEYEVVANY